jgi:predicted nucleic acid-binding protein
VTSGHALVDTGPLVALLSRRDAWHARCVSQFASLGPGLWTCWPVITEAVHILRHPDPVATLMGQIHKDNIRLMPLDEDDVPPVREILDRYSDQGFDLADACLMYLAERERITQVFTLDRRHFGIYRLSNGSALQLLPDSGT